MAEKTQEVYVKEVRKNFINPNDIKVEFSNDMTINHNEREFFMSFWLTEQPMIFSKEDVEGIETVESVLVAKVVMTPPFARAILKALQKNIKGFDKKQEAKK